MLTQRRRCGPRGTAYGGRDSERAPAAAAGHPLEMRLAALGVGGHLPAPGPASTWPRATHAQANP